MTAYDENCLLIFAASRLSASSLVDLDRMRVRHLSVRDSTLGVALFVLLSLIYMATLLVIIFEHCKANILYSASLSFTKMSHAYLGGPIHVSFR